MDRQVTTDPPVHRMLLNSRVRTTPLWPHQALALAVIKQAFRDAGDAEVGRSVRAQACRFLADSTMLGEWCEVAGLDPEYVSDLVARHRRTLFRVVGVGSKPRQPRHAAAATAARPMQYAVAAQPGGRGGSAA
jgi:hypothetical protein